jgi:microcystin-dependent protein
MSADLFSSFIGMTLQATGNNNNDWGTILNGSLTTIERGLAGNISHAVTGGTLDLSGTPPPNGMTQALDFIQAFDGALTAKQIVVMPNLSKFWYIFNNTTGIFPLHVNTPGGNPTQIPQGSGRLVICDGNGNIIRQDRDAVGAFVHESVLSAGNLSCDGSSHLISDYPDLYAKIGTIYGSVDSLHFTLPLLTDTGRFLRSTTSTLTVGTAQSNQNKSHTHTGSGTTATESVAHTHTGSGTTGAMSANASHAHGVSPAGALGGTSPVPDPGPGSVSVLQNAGTLSINATNTDHTHSFSVTTGTESVSHTHTYSFTTSTGSADGTEARPEALAIIISIRY